MKKQKIGETKFTTGKMPYENEMCAYCAKRANKKSKDIKPFG